MKKKIWLSVLTCDICQAALSNKFIDGGTIYGPWAIMCPDCHKKLGSGLGTGKGQEYTYNSKTKEWEKTNG